MATASIQGLQVWHHQAAQAFVLAALLAAAPKAKAAEATAPLPGQTQTEAEAEEATRNKRVQTNEGSLSAFSGQVSLSYQGSTLHHPFSEEAPNPTHDAVPPLVRMSGDVSLRYRLDKRTTFGLGGGIATETPFQGPKHTTADTPYISVARSSQFGAVHSFASASLSQATDHQYYSKFGYRQGLTLSDEFYYETQSGLSAGMSLVLSGNTFADGDYPRSRQVDYKLGVYPFAEYSLNDTFSIRSVIGKGWQHRRDHTDRRSMLANDLYQTLGVGVSITKAWFVYFFVKAIPYSGQDVTRDNTTAGFSTTFNLF